MGPDPDPTSDVPGMSIWGWMSPAELTWLGEQAAKMRNVVEIGCLHGRSSMALALACPGPTYHIDPWSDAGWTSWTTSFADLMKLPDGPAVPIRAASPGAGVQVPDPVDMVFIDGAHDYESVVADIEYWLSRAQVLLCGHDYVSAEPGINPGFPDVATAVDQILGAENISVAPDTAIWAYWVK